MTLVDTSVWIDHLHQRDPRLARLLSENAVLMHPWVRGELALGTLSGRERFLRLLDYLPDVRPAGDENVFDFIESTGIYGRGIGWVDAGLLASCLARPCRFWTRDKRLAVVAAELGIAE
ncbi:MAG: type II toxin-antitoxin system VapC family toxin [Rectinemataceae bacterium]